ncbi:MAG: hypothetical protein HC886_03170 [Leptolyngbyaceae cyanobacterium SM1_1_3]|nr:hypothetical protein [Leptolyngbyaceae cyanobacterium SM1_1_3]NJN02096.1 hypothetical protein [Leptolyngbyaceae cyanobacterium RM1_1_2]NJO09705.1 hypothetical protein [Leptolyngbyaceae cyanobacterium SL_1_1]
MPLLTPLCLAVVLFLSSCSAPETGSRWEETPTQPATTVSSDEILPGSQFNQFFPPDGNGYERVYSQEKSGFAEAKLKQNGTDLAMLAVSDTAANPPAVTKYESSNRTIAGYPAVVLGDTASSILVGDRIQVKVLSRDSSFTATDREAWIQKFDLAGLERLVK